MAKQMFLALFIITSSFVKVQTERKTLTYGKLHPAISRGKIKILSNYHHHRMKRLFIPQCFRYKCVEMYLRYFILFIYFVLFCDQ